MLTDLQRAWRMHTAQPAFTLIAVLMLAVGIGVNTSVFSVASVVLLKSLPYPEPGRLTAIHESRIRERVADNVVSIADFLDWREQNAVFSSVAAYSGNTYTFTGRGEPEQIPGAEVTGHFFETLGASPLWGRTLQASDESAGAGALAVLNHGFWERRFGSDPSIVGQSIILYGIPHTVIGVMPKSFVAPIRSWEIFTPMKFNANSRTSRGNHLLRVIARLKPGVPIERARSDMDVISKRLEKDNQVNTGHYANVVPLDEAMRGKTRPAMLVLLGAVGLVLLIACFNVANLLLARSVARAREISIRLAMGASRWRMVRQLLAESVALSVAGAGAGLIGALWMVGYIKTFMPAELALANEDVRIDGAVLLFSTLLALASGMFSGLAPALTASSGNFNDVLRAGGRGQTASPWRQRQRAAIVIGEMALSVVLLIGAGLLIRSFVKLMEVNPGFRAEKLLTMTITLPDSSYRAGPKKMAFQKQLIENVSRLPGVQRAGMTSFLPMTDQGSRMGFQVEGVDPDPREPRRANWRVASPGYFETMQIPLRAGRLFAESDHRESPIVMLINETAAKKYWPGRDPVGTHAKLVSMVPWATVVGVVGDVKHWGLDAAAAPEAYLSLWQVPFSLNNLVIRTQGDPARLAGQVREQLRALDRDLPPAAIRSMQDLLDESTSVRRFEMMLLTGLAAIAVLLAAAGIYAQLAYSVTQRMSELGLRMALGASPMDVVRMIIGQGLGLAGAGALAGVAGALALTRLLERFLFGVKALDPVTMVLAPVTLMVVAAVACMVPAWRASRADPAVALRHE